MRSVLTEIMPRQKFGDQENKVSRPHQHRVPLFSGYFKPKPPRVEISRINSLNRSLHSLSNIHMQRTPNQQNLQRRFFVTIPCPTPSELYHVRL